jgi:hypothetical protein
MVPTFFRCFLTSEPLYFSETNAATEFAAWIAINTSAALSVA